MLIESTPKIYREGPTQTLFTRGSGFWSTISDEFRKNFFRKLTEPASQRENWYAVTPYVAEFWCTISNIGFIYVGVKKKCPELIFAGVASAVSHAIPRQWMNVVDKIGVVLVITRFLREYQTLTKNPRLLGLLGLAVVINLADSYLARTKGLTWPHIVWHLSSAFLVNIVLNYSNRK